MADDDFDVGTVAPSPPVGQSDSGTTTQQPTPQPTSQSDTGGQAPTNSQGGPDMGQIAINAYNQAEQHYQEMQKKLEPLYDQLQKSLSQPLPQVPQLEKMPQMPTKQQIDQRLNQGVFSYLAIGLPLALIMGRRGGNAAMYAMGAFGTGLRDLKQGNREGASDMFKLWQESAQQVRDNNTEIMNQYREVLTNRNLNLTQQQQLIGVIAQRYNDNTLHQLTELKDISAIIDNLRQKQDVHEKWEEEHNTLSQKNLAEMSHGELEQRYRTMMIHDHDIDPYKDPQSYMKATEIYPFNRYADEEKAKEKQKPSESRDTMYEQWKDYIAEAYREKHGHYPSGEEELNQAKKDTPYTEWVYEMRKPGGTDPKTNRPFGFKTQGQGDTPEDYSKSFESLKGFFNPSGSE